ncbi:hypothetical protein GJ744_006297 [Endocarpon pusillum]|uniref:Uncharacterized protein n=1 Tax=Endocarpon pusillum TaxID=364733 RepID=A0A8H7ABM0_9EURO|nr:hypothetical protein GJ744_006297 [Endocarpon pusillum]
MSSEVAFKAKAPLEPLVAEDEDKGLMCRSGYGSPSPRRATRSRLFNKFFRRNKKKSNKPRVVLGKSGSILAKSIIHHLIPLGICIGLIWLDRTRYFWFEDNHPAILNCLQFAAKLHELLILASLSSMVMYITKRRLIGAGGVPFGFISTSYQLSDIQILSESAFLKSFSWKQLEPSLFFLGLFMGSIALFSPLVGPASAIAFIPNLNFYPYPGAFANSTGRLLYLTWGPFNGTAPMSFTDMWPTQLSNQTLTNPACAWNGTISDERHCPAGTYGDTFEWFWDRPDFNWTKRSADMYSSVLEPSSRFTYRTITTLSNGTSGLPGKGNETDTGIAVSSTPVETLIRSLP